MARNKPTIRSLITMQDLAKMRYATATRLLLLNPDEVTFQELLEIHESAKHFADITPPHDVAYQHFQNQLKGIVKAITYLYMATCVEPKDIALHILVRHGREAQLVEVCETYELPHKLVHCDGIYNEFLIDLSNLDIDGPLVQEGYEYLHSVLHEQKNRNWLASGYLDAVQLVYSKLYFK